LFAQTGINLSPEHACKAARAGPLAISRIAALPIVGSCHETSIDGKVTQD
jgi:hypothetical protein